MRAKRAEKVRRTPNGQTDLAAYIQIQDTRYREESKEYKAGRFEKCSYRAKRGTNPHKNITKSSSISHHEQTKPSQEDIPKKENGATIVVS